MGFDYIEEALKQHHDLDRAFYESILEDMEIESDFLLTALENNIILEAEDPSSDTFWDKFVKAINALFDKFRLALLDLVNGNEKFVTEELPKITGFDFNGLSVSVIPYWEKTNISEVNQKIRNDLVPLLDTKKPSSDKISEFSSRDAIEKYDKFGELLIDGKTFAESVKIKFLYGFNETEPIKAKKFGSAEKDEAKSNEFKKVCVTNMLPYVTDYRKTIKDVQESNNALKREIVKYRQKLKSQSVGESFSILENTLMKNTELFYCLNHEVLFEAEGENQTEQTKTNEEPKLNKVEDATKGNGSKSGGNPYKNYAKIAAQLINIAIAAEMTSKEQIYKSYMAVLRGVYNVRNPKKEKKEKTETKTEENK